MFKQLFSIILGKGDLSTLSILFILTISCPFIGLSSETYFETCTNPNIFFEDFESCAIPPGWTTFATDGGTGISFDQGPNSCLLYTSDAADE